MDVKIVCCKCKLVKSRNDFYYRNNGKRRPECKSCHYRPNYKKFWDYKLTQEQYNELLESQNGHCALCNETKGLEIDHDHSCCPKRPTCGKCTRGLLCDKHNRGLGFFTKEELNKLKEYLKIIGG